MMFIFKLNMSYLLYCIYIFARMIKLVNIHFQILVDVKASNFKVSRLQVLSLTSLYKKYHKHMHGTMVQWT